MAKTEQQLEVRLEKELAAIRLRRRAARFCPLLLARVRALPEGIDLVCFVSDSCQANNRFALIDWIVRQLEDPEFVDAAEHQPVDALLLERLMHDISAKAAANDDAWVAQ